MKNFYQNVSHQLKQAGIENPGLESRILFKHVLGISDADLIRGSEKPVSSSDQQQIEAFIQRRVAGEPLSRILGQREFYGRDFIVTPDVLDPRPDTETIIDVAVKKFEREAPLRILDLGTGSGCILVTLLCEFLQATGMGIDRSAEAIAIAQKNAEQNDVTDRIAFTQGDWAENLEESFDLIVSNPPYIPSPDISNLESEVKNHDPILALDGGNDGLDAYKTIFPQLKKNLSKGGTALFEIGISQLQQVVRLVENAGLSVRESHDDLAGIPRVVEISFGEN